MGDDAERGASFVCLSVWLASSASIHRAVVARRNLSPSEALAHWKPRRQVTRDTAPGKWKWLANGWRGCCCRAGKVLGGGEAALIPSATCDVVEQLWLRYYAYARYGLRAIQAYVYFLGCKIYIHIV